jgi:hypothetical protein
MMLGCKVGPDHTRPAVNVPGTIARHMLPTTRRPSGVPSIPTESNGLRVDDAMFKSDWTTCVGVQLRSVQSMSLKAVLGS